MRTIADFRRVGRYTDFLVNEINEDGKVVHLTNLEYGGRGKQQTGLGNDQKKETKTETETETEKQEKNDEGGSASLSGEKETSTSAPAPPAPVKEFEVLTVPPDTQNIHQY